MTILSSEGGILEQKTVSSSSQEGKAPVYILTALPFKNNYW